MSKENAHSERALTNCCFFYLFLVFLVARQAIQVGFFFCLLPVASKVH